jgi:hypothetical protein
MSAEAPDRFDSHRRTTFAFAPARKTESNATKLVDTEEEATPGSEAKATDFLNQMAVISAQLVFYPRNKPVADNRVLWPTSRVTKESKEATLMVAKAQTKAGNCLNELQKRTQNQGDLWECVNDIKPTRKNRYLPTPHVSIALTTLQKWLLEPMHPTEVLEQLQTLWEGFTKGKAEDVVSQMVSMFRIKEARVSNKTSAAGKCVHLTFDVDSFRLRDFLMHIGQVAK